MLKSPISR